MARVGVAAVLLALALGLVVERHRIIDDLTTYDAAPSEPALLPVGSGPGLPPAQRVRVVLVDGLAVDTAASLPAWTAACARGVQLTVDVGFPSVSLPVEVALWTGLTQQQTGIVSNRGDRGLVPPLDTRGIPAQIAGSRAVAESHGWIARSLGFAQVDEGGDWKATARAAVASDARLVFVHVLAVDDAGHHHGHDSPEYAAAARDADATIAELVAAAPGARWFLLSDHGHLAGPHGGHGGDERAVRQVAGCIAGPGIAPPKGPRVHVVDVARALADSLGAKLELASRGRPLSVALAAPLAPDQALPPLPLAAGAVAIVLLVIGAFAGTWPRRWWLAPWWLAIAAASLVLVRGVPTLSTPMIYAPAGRAMYLPWLPALAVCAIATWFGLRTTTLARVVVAQLALPFAAVAADATACGAWPALLGAHVAPVVPHFTAWLSPLLLVTAHGCAAVALALVARAVAARLRREEKN
ncbi:MAG: alkaline phosphatase family protein [Acidobacteriota bacterium]